MTYCAPLFKWLMGIPVIFQKPPLIAGGVDYKSAFSPGVLPVELFFRKCRGKKLQIKPPFY